jgi:hypothetical protein
LCGIDRQTLIVALPVKVKVKQNIMQPVRRADARMPGRMDTDVIWIM